MKTEFIVHVQSIDRITPLVRKTIELEFMDVINKYVNPIQTINSYSIETKKL